MFSNKVYAPIIMATIAALAGLYFFLSTNIFTYDAQETTGYIASYKTGLFGAKKQAVVLFTVDGRQYQHIIQISKGGTYKYPLGRQFRILYDPADPSDSRINEFSRLWGLSIVLFGSAGVFIIIALIIKIRGH